LLPGGGIAVIDSAKHIAGQHDSPSTGVRRHFRRGLNHCPVSVHLALTTWRDTGYCKTTHRAGVSLFVAFSYVRLFGRLLIGFAVCLLDVDDDHRAKKRFHTHFLCLGGRDVVVEAEEVVRVVAPLDLPQPLEVGISVGRAYAFDGLVGSSVVKVAAAAG